MKLYIKTRNGSVYALDAEAKRWERVAVSEASGSRDVVLCGPMPFQPDIEVGQPLILPQDGEKSAVWTSPVTAISSSQEKVGAEVMAHG